MLICRWELNICQVWGVAWENWCLFAAWKNWKFHVLMNVLRNIQRLITQWIHDSTGCVYTVGWHVTFNYIISRKLHLRYACESIQPKKPPTPTDCIVWEYLCKAWHLIWEKAERRGGQSVLKSWPDSVGAGGGGKGLSLPSHFTQKISEMSASEAV